MNIVVTVICGFLVVGCGPLVAPNDVKLSKKELNAAYESVFLQEDRWENKHLTYSLESVPVEGDPENQKYSAPYWRFAYTAGNARKEFEHYVSISGKTESEVINSLIDKYGVTSALVEVAKGHIDEIELKRFVWSKGAKASEYFLWRHHPSLNPKLDSYTVEGDSFLVVKRKSAFHIFDKSYKEIVAKELNGIHPDMMLKDYWNISCALAAYGRTFPSLKLAKAHEEKLIKDMDLKYGKIKIF